MLTQSDTDEPTVGRTSHGLEHSAGPVWPTPATACSFHVSHKDGHTTTPTITSATHRSKVQSRHTHTHTHILAGQVHTLHMSQVAKKLRDSYGQVSLPTLLNPYIFINTRNHFHNMCSCMHVIGCTTEHRIYKSFT